MTSNPLFVELLEPRIAPAILVNGGNLLGAKFGPTTGETSSGGNTVTLVKVLSGSALVFFDGGTSGSGENSHITSISVGPNTKLDITGDVTGDIIANLDANGRLTDSDNNPSNGEDGGILLPNKIKGITTHPLNGGAYGSIGRIISGGDVKNVVTNSEFATIHGLYAGDGVFRAGPTISVSTGGVDFNSIQSGLQDTFSLSKDIGVFKPKASVLNATINIGAGLEAFAGSGADSATGVGGEGGAVFGVHVIKSFAGFGSASAIYLYGGDGGTGATGGAGGSISSFTDDGSTALVRVQTGHGGTGTAGDGGVGGSFLSSTITTKSPAYSFDIGSGGDGTAHGGGGGSVKGLSFTSQIVTTQQFTASGARSSGTLIASADFNGDGIADTVVVNSNNGNAIIAVGGSGGGFTPVAQSSGTAFVGPQGLTPTDIVTGDFNGDGAIDYAVSYASSNNIGVFYNDGAGHFTASQIKLANSPYRLVTGDFSGSASLDFAYLTLPSTNSTGLAQSSSIYEVQNNDATGFVAGRSATVIAGTASDLVAARIDADAHTDVFVSLNDKSGTVESLLATGVSSSAPFTGASNILTGVAHITNLDATTVGTTLSLLAFSDNTTEPTTATTGASDTPAVTPALKIFSVNAAGQQTSVATGSVVSGATSALFVGNNADYGVLTPSSVQVTSLDGTTSHSYTAADGLTSNFAPLGTDPTDPVVAVGPIPTRLFYNTNTSLTAVNLPIVPQVFDFLAGDGGHGGSASGGKGGGIKTLTFGEMLDSGADGSGGTYTVNIFAGAGGASDGAAGGIGGNLNKTNISVDPANTTTADDTTLLSMHAGVGGVGLDGGKGGSINTLTATAIEDQITAGGVTVNSFAVDLGAGAGGAGTQGHGGLGGSVTLNGKASLTGVSFYDANSPSYRNAALTVTAGAGGDGATVGGDGGSVVNVGSQNALLGDGSVLNTNELASAAITAGKGGVGHNGAGGIGGNVLQADVSVQRTSTLLSNTLGVLNFLITGGDVQVTAGDGGNSASAVGGAGGSVKSSTLASVQGSLDSGLGVLVRGGHGGDGAAGGGAGGQVATLQINSPSAPSVFGAAIFGGDGGAALGGGVGGDGGKIKDVTQTKDVNSSINIILAGSGGAGNGVGGSVSKINTVGFIGAPNSSGPLDAAGNEDTTKETRLGAFNTSVYAPEIAAMFPGGMIPQGVFAGRGEGGNGSVKTVTARQIAAIGAAPDVNGLFAVASIVSGIHADLIGFDEMTGTTDTFDSSAAGHVSPSTAVPIDGFILAAAVSDVVTKDDIRTAGYTFLG